MSLFVVKVVGTLSGHQHIVEFTELLIARRRDRDFLVSNGAPFEEIQAHNQQTLKLMEAQRNVVIDEDLTKDQLQELKSLCANSGDPEINAIHEKFWKLMDSASS